MTNESKVVGVTEPTQERWKSKQRQVHEFISNSRNLEEWQSIRWDDKGELFESLWESIENWSSVRKDIASNPVILKRSRWIWFENTKFTKILIGIPWNSARLRDIARVPPSISSTMLRN
jgi:hypothetical protein